MRFLAIAVILLSIPGLFALVKSSRDRRWAYFLIGILPFTISAANVDAALINWAGWPGYAKGLILTLLDTLALALIANERRPFGDLPFVGLFAFYFGAVALSMLQAELPMASGFYAFQLLRVFIVFVATAAIANKPVAFRWLAMGLAAGAIFQAVVTIDQRLGGAVQATGTMGHQNLLGLMLHFVTLPLLAVMLGGEKSKLVMAGVMGALVAVALGASRGAVGFSAIGIALLFTLSLVRRSTPHKWRMVGAGVLMLALATPFAISSLERRFEGRSAGGNYDERAAFERAAKMMWADHPMGVGANEYVVMANTGGYSERAGVVWLAGSRSTNVHNAYLLVAAETGWLGLISFIALFAWPIIRGLQFAFADRRDARGDIVLGAATAVLVTGAHNLYEWIFVNTQSQYLFAMALGIIAGMVRQRRREARQRRGRKATDAVPRVAAVTGPVPVEVEPFSSARSGSSGA